MNCFVMFVVFVCVVGCLLRLSDLFVVSCVKLRCAFACAAVCVCVFAWCMCVCVFCV